MKKLSIKLDEGRVSYLTDGQGSPLLLLHSLGVSSESWSRVIKPMAQSCSVYAWDMMGHGDSDKPPWNFQIEDYAKNYGTMSDEAATKMIDDYLELQAERLELMELYLPKFKKVLSPKKVARYYQLENKVDAAIDYGLAAQIPLIK